MSDDDQAPEDRSKSVVLVPVLRVERRDPDSSAQALENLRTLWFLSGEGHERARQALLGRAESDG